jgi:hypothetical protein
MLRQSDKGTAGLQASGRYSVCCTSRCTAGALSSSCSTGLLLSEFLALSLLHFLLCIVCLCSLCLLTSFLPTPLPYFAAHVLMAVMNGERPVWSAPAEAQLPALHELYKRCVLDLARSLLSAYWEVHMHPS